MRFGCPHRSLSNFIGYREPGPASYKENIPKKHSDVRLNGEVKGVGGELSHTYSSLPQVISQRLPSLQVSLGPNITAQTIHHSMPRRDLEDLT